jgi:hypothetical protein
MALVPQATRVTATSATIAPSGVHEATLAYGSPASIGQLCVDVTSIASTPESINAKWRCFGNVISVTMR